MNERDEACTSELVSKTFPEKHSGSSPYCRRLRLTPGSIVGAPKNTIYHSVNCGFTNSAGFIHAARHYGFPRSVAAAAY